VILPFLGSSKQFVLHEGRYSEQFSDQSREHVSSILHNSAIGCLVKPSDYSRLNRASIQPLLLLLLLLL
jgi:hypothetical protein